MANFKIAVVAGDGIGPEVTREACRALEKTGKVYGHGFAFTDSPAGGYAIDHFGDCLPESTLHACMESDSVLLGAVGGPKWDDLPGDKRPERALLGLRKALGLYSNLRPALIYKPLLDACPLRKEVIGDGLDIMIVRELTGGIYFGEHGRREGRYGHEAFDVECYSEAEVRRIAKVAFDAAMKRKKLVTSIDKSNVLESSRLWRSTVVETAKEYPEVTLNHMYVDNAAMQLVRDPNQFDVIVTTNMFGDILSDEASMITGSIGLLPSASIGATSLGMYEPIHGSAPDIAGKNLANPIAAILACAMMIKYSFGLSREASAIEDAVIEALEEGYRTVDIAINGETAVSTSEMGDIICEGIR